MGSRRGTKFIPGDHPSHLGRAADGIPVVYHPLYPAAMFFSLVTNEAIHVLGFCEVLSVVGSL